MHSRFRAHLLVCAALLLAFAGTALAQGGGTQNELSAIQRLDIMRSKLDSMRRSLTNAISSLQPANASQSAGEKKNPDDPRERLRGLDKEVGSLISEVNNLRAKQERSERYDPTTLDRLEASVADLNNRVQAGLQATAGARKSVSATTAAAQKKKKKKGRLFGLLGGGGDDKYEELTSTVAPGRDRVLFEEAVN